MQDRDFARPFARPGFGEKRVPPRVCWATAFTIGEPTTAPSLVVPPTSVLGGRFPFGLSPRVRGSALSSEGRMLRHGWELKRRQGRRRFRHFNGLGRTLTSNGHQWRRTSGGRRSIARALGKGDSLVRQALEPAGSPVSGPPQRSLSRQALARQQSESFRAWTVTFPPGPPRACPHRSPQSREQSARVQPGRATSLPSAMRQRGR